MHADSKLFLNGGIICSETNSSAYIFELSEKYGNGMLF